MFDSRFYFTGAGVLGLMFALAGQWAMLILIIFIMFLGIWQADIEQQHDASSNTLHRIMQLFELPPETPVMPLDGFIGHQLLHYEQGVPVFQQLFDGEHYWVLRGSQAEHAAMPGEIIVYPGMIYRPRGD